MSSQGCCLEEFGIEKYSLSCTQFNYYIARQKAKTDKELRFTKLNLSSNGSKGKHTKDLY